MVLQFGLRVESTQHRPSLHEQGEGPWLPARVVPLLSPNRAAHQSARPRHRQSARSLPRVLHESALRCLAQRQSLHLDLAAHRVCLIIYYGGIHRIHSERHFLDKLSSISSQSALNNSRPMWTMSGSRQRLRWGGEEEEYELWTFKQFAGTTSGIGNSARGLSHQIRLPFWCLQFSHAQTKHGIEESSLQNDQGWKCYSRKKIYEIFAGEFGAGPQKWSLRGFELRFLLQTRHLLCQHAAIPGSAELWFG